MINITRLYCGVETSSDPLRYGRSTQKTQEVARAGGRPLETEKSASSRRPVTVWTMSRRCNLLCKHCYTDSHNLKYTGELSTHEGKALIEDLAHYKIPALLLSGGEPLMRPDFFELAEYGSSLGLRLTLSTNGTLITHTVAQRIRDTGFSYVGISLDGLGAVHDYFRGRRGAFNRALSGFRNCLSVGQKVGLRLTLTRHTAGELDEIFNLLEREGIQRACFYHLVPAGRGTSVAGLSPEETRAAINKIMDRTRDMVERGIQKEILTVGNAADGVLVYERLKREKSDRTEEVKSLIAWNGGGAHGSGVGLANIDHLGNVHPDQFWQTYTLGNVREQPFSKIWSESDDEVLKGLRQRNSKLTGRCAGCRYLPLCGGGFRIRALRANNDIWSSDPGCYFTDEEIGVRAAAVA